MTWSIIARDETTGRAGIAVATRFFAVGARVPHIRTGVGAIATQAMTNPTFGPHGLALLGAGASAPEAVRMLLAGDEGRDVRQLHIMDNAGGFSAATGKNCVPWCGHLVGETFSVAGNVLAGPEVIEATAEVYKQRSDLPFAQRLLAAMQAGEAKGGDKRGRQSAALLIHDAEDHSALDIRVDDHAAPLDELERLERVSREGFIHFRRFGPTRENPTGLLDRDALWAAVAKSIEDGYL